MFENEDLIKKLTLETASKKSAKELVVLADNYYRGINVTQDYEMAFILTKMAAEKNFKMAQYNLGYFYLTGEGTRKDIDKAIEIFKSLQNDVNALDRLCEIYSLNKYGKKDTQQAIKYYKLSAQAGSAYGMFNLAKAYQDGDGVEQDYAQAKKYYELAAKKGLPDALSNLGCMYENGLGVEADINKAFEYFKKAAEKGSVIGITNLGNFYYEGRGVEQNYEKAYECMVKGVQENHPPAKYGLAFMYYKGKYVQKDLNKAVELLKEAAKENEAQSNYLLGYMYNVGEGVNQDLKKAMEYYKKSAELGYADAYSDIGTLYMQGRGVDQDYDIANKYFKEGIKFDSDLAKCNLAASYVNGTGVEKDPQKAIEILNSIDDTNNNKHYYLGVIKHACLDGQEKTRALVNEVIDSYNKFIELTNDPTEYKYISMIYYKLAEAYLDLYYIDQASANNRNQEHFSKQNPNREKAKEYIKLSKDLIVNVDERAFEILKSDLRIAEDLLNDEALDLSTYSYEQFKKEYFGKHDNLFLLTKKQEYELFDNGIKYYFNKREKEDEIKKKLEIYNANFEKNKSLIRKRLEEKGVENIDEKLEELHLAKLDQVTNDSEIDFSITVNNIDKYFEEILHFLFVDCMYDHKHDLYQQIILKNIEEIKASLADCTEETLKELNFHLNGIDKTIALKPEILTKKLEIFAEKFNKNWNFKSIADDRINALNTYYQENKKELDEKQTSLIKKFLDNSQARKEFAELSKPEKFELGSLFHMAFNDASSSKDAVAQKIVDPIFVEFVTSVNDNLSISEASLKLRELLIKIEMFRVIVRNVASHKSILMQPAVERGLNISIIQENSIFNLLDNMFGDFLNKKYVDKMVEDIDLSI